MGQGLRLEQQQGIYLTAQMLQGISMVAMSAQELVEYVHDNLDQNPFLEEAQPPVLESEYSPDAQIPFESGAPEQGKYDYHPSTDELGQKLIGQGRLFGDGSYEKTKQDFSFEQYLIVQPSMEEYLQSQMALELSKNSDIAIGQYLIGNLDKDGYLRVSTTEVASYFGVSVSQVEQVLAVLQACSPTGIGARNLQEYLLLQLRASGKSTPLAEQVITENLDDLAGGKIDKLARQFKVPVAKVQEIQDLIKTFRAHADLSFGNQQNFDIWPEVLVVKGGDGYLVSMQDVYLPQLTINQEYVALTSKPGIDKDTAKYLRKEYKSAEALIEGINQRRQSIFQVASQIVEAQKEFLEKGIDFLAPLTMAQIAKATEFSESTVSRVANGNYMQTPQGIFELRYFFNSGLAKTSGKDISSKSIKHHIQELVSKEDPAKPLSDTDIQDALAKKDLEISRRTVNKYRTSLGIPTNTQRRRFS